MALSLNPGLPTKSMGPCDVRAETLLSGCGTPNSCNRANSKLAWISLIPSGLDRLNRHSEKAGAETQSAQDHREA